MPLSLVAMTTRTRHQCLTLGPEEWPDALMVEKPPSGRCGYGDLLVQLVRIFSMERITTRKKDLEIYNVGR